MSKRQMPKVGEYAVVGHGMIDPQYWWISLVEWSSKDAFLCRDTHGEFPDRSPTICHEFIISGTKEECERVYHSARDQREIFRVRYNEAKCGVEAVQAEIKAAISEIVGEAALRLAGDVRMIEP
jgi:hypothetical protein